MNDTNSAYIGRQDGGDPPSNNINNEYVSPYMIETETVINPDGSSRTTTKEYNPDAFREMLEAKYGFQTALALESAAESVNRAETTQMVSGMNEYLMQQQQQIQQQMYFQQQQMYFQQMQMNQMMCNVFQHQFHNPHIPIGDLGGGYFDGNPPQIENRNQPLQLSDNRQNVFSPPTHGMAEDVEFVIKDDLSNSDCHSKGNLNPSSNAPDSPGMDSVDFGAIFKNL